MWAINFAYWRLHFCSSDHNPSHLANNVQMPAAPALLPTSLSLSFCVPDFHVLHHHLSFSGWSKAASTLCDMAPL